MTQFFKLVAELGLPIAATAGMGVFIVFIIEYICLLYTSDAADDA